MIPQRLQAEVNDLLPQGYWATATAFPEGVFGSVQVDVYLRPHPKGRPIAGTRPVVQLSVGEYYRSMAGTRPVVQLLVGEYYRSDQFETARYIKGRLTISGRLEWQPFPDLRTAVLNLIAQHRLGVGNA